MVIEHAVRTVDTAEGITPRQPLLSMVVLDPSFLGRTISEANLPLIFQGRETSTEREVVLEA